MRSLSEEEKEKRKQTKKLWGREGPYIFMPRLNSENFSRSRETQKLGLKTSVVKILTQFVDVVVDGLLDSPLSWPRNARREAANRYITNSLNG